MKHYVTSWVILPKWITAQARCSCGEIFEGGGRDEPEATRAAIDAAATHIASHPRDEDAEERRYEIPPVRRSSRITHQSTRKGQTTNARKRTRN